MYCKQVNCGDCEATESRKAAGKLVSICTYVLVIKQADKAALAGHSQTALSMIAKDLNKK